MTLAAAVIGALVLAAAMDATPSTCGCPSTPPSAEVCGSDGVTYPSKCEMDCAVTAVEGLSVARFGPCPRPSTRLGAPAPLGPRGRDGGEASLEALARCTLACGEAYRACLTLCDAAACWGRCADHHLLDCNCACAQDRPPADSSATTVPPLGAAAPPFWKRLAVPRDDSRNGAARAALQCYNSAMLRLDECAEPCTPTRDEACAWGCVRPAFEDICGCERSQSGGGSGGAAPYARPLLTALLPAACCYLLRAPR